jgi:hypothetical protein
MFYNEYLAMKAASYLQATKNLKNLTQRLCTYFFTILSHIDLGGHRNNGLLVSVNSLCNLGRGTL